MTMCPIFNFYILDNTQTLKHTNTNKLTNHDYTVDSHSDASGASGCSWVVDGDGHAGTWLSQMLSHPANDKGFGCSEGTEVIFVGQRSGERRGARKGLSRKGRGENVLAIVNVEVESGSEHYD
jgi:hypothetical protein